MAIGIGNAVTVRAGTLDTVVELDCDKVTDEIAAFVYRHSESGDTESYVKLGNINTGVFGDEVSIDGADILNPSIIYLQDTKLALFYHDNASGEDDEIYGAVVNTSGLTPTINLAGKAEIATDFDGTMCPAMGSASLGLLAYRNNDGGLQQWWQRFDIAGNSVVLSGSPLDNDDNVDINPFRQSLCSIGVSRYVQVYSQDTTGDLTAVVLNAQVGLSKGPEAIFTSSSSVLNFAIVPINSTHCLILYEEDNFTTRSVKAVVITIAGDIIDFGDPATLDTGATLLNGGYIAIIKRSSTKFVVAYNLSSSSSTIRVESLTLNGTTVTEDGDGATFTGFNTNLRVLGYPGTEGIVYYQNSSEDAVYRVLSNLPELGNQAKFYHGFNTLTEKFTLPWAGVQPQAMTLDRSLGAVVMGSNEPSTEAVIYSQHPYTTGTSTSLGFPTGTSIRALKWI